MSMSDTMKGLILNDLLKTPEKKVIFIDPESEYRQLSEQDVHEKCQRLYLAAPGSTMKDTIMRYIKDENIKTRKVEEIK